MCMFTVGVVCVFQLALSVDFHLFQGARRGTAEIRVIGSSLFGRGLDETH